jgi:hypothetical protein
MENEPRKMSVLHTNEKKNLAFIYKILNVSFSHYGLKERKSAIKIVVGMVRRRKYENITIEKTCKICRFRIM